MSRGLGGGAVDLVQGLEGSRGPDDEATEVTTRGELEEVEGGDGAGLDTGDVAESSDELLAVNLGVVNDQRATALAVAAATELTLTSTELLGLLGLLDIGTGTNSLQEAEGSSGLGNGSSLKGGRVDDQGNLGDVVDLVATGEEQGNGSGGSQSGADSVSPRWDRLEWKGFSQDMGRFFFLPRESGGNSLLALVDLDVPLAPDLGRGEHATGTAHVTEGSLTGTVSTTTGDTGDTGNSTTCEFKC